MNGNILQRLDQLPPFVTYALARDRRRHRPKYGDLVKLSGLSERTFLRIARKFSWESVKVKDVDAFCAACNVDLLKLRKQKDFMRKTVNYQHPFSHLSKQQFRVLNQQCLKWKEMRKAATLCSPP